MASLEELRNERLKKLSLLREGGHNPYPAKTEISHAVSFILTNFDKLVEKDEEVTIGGRVMALRQQGGLIFTDLFDNGEKIQVLFKEDEIGEAFTLLADTIDIGDFIQVTGKLIVTKRGEKTVQAGSWKILAKSLRPLPDKWSGLQDVEERLRKRYLDILLNEETRDLVIKRGQFWQAIRNFLLERGFLEVETPILETIPGGADAKPFITHHNALDMDVYLRISMGELWQKELVVAGFEKTFEIGRQFRNEGMDSEHLQDYTQMEFYWAYSDYEKGMDLVEEMYKYVAEKTFGTLKFKIKGFDVDLSEKWEKIDYKTIIAKQTGINIEEASLQEMEKALQKLKIDYDKEGWNRTRAIDNLWKYCRKSIAGPVFLINHPIEVSPLAKKNDKNEKLVQRFQVIIGGSENGNGYSELNDPIDQAERFAEQQKLRDKGDQEAQRFDKDFVEALEYGMPPTCGFGVSERLFAFFMDKPLRDCQIFPLMRPKD